jgi:hypothetical protein
MKDFILELTSDSGTNNDTLKGAIPAYWATAAIATDSRATDVSNGPYESQRVQGSGVTGACAIQPMPH